MHYHVKRQPQHHSNPLKCWSLGYSSGIPPNLFLTVYERERAGHIKCFSRSRLQGQLSPSHGLELQRPQPAPNGCEMPDLSPTALVLAAITALGHLGGSSCRDLVPTRGYPDLAKGIYLQVLLKPSTVTVLCCIKCTDI